MFCKSHSSLDKRDLHNFCATAVQKGMRSLQLYHLAGGADKKSAHRRVSAFLKVYKPEVDRVLRMGK
jgi:hypothetical protein